MAYNRTQVHALLTASEKELFEASLSPFLQQWPLKELRQLRVRTRRMRDKHEDLFRKQHRALPRNKAPKVVVDGDVTALEYRKSNERTRKKAQIFTEALTRVEKRIEMLEQALRRQAAKALRHPKAKKPMAPKKVVCAPKAASVAPRTKTSALSADKARRSQSPQKRKQQAHLSSLNRRNQAKKDSRKG
ncbi:MAG: hypothetical protein LWX11_09955 [Firmicutes bacterium]|nr:hypothetical protein [Bacillota bacterium]